MQNVSIFSLFRIARKRWMILMAAFVVAAAIAFSYCTFIAKPVYGATVSLLATNGVPAQSDSATQKVLSSDVQASLSLADTIVDILKTNSLYEEISSRLDGEIGYKTLAANTTVKRRGDDTLFIDITYCDSDPQRAMKIANLFADTATEHIDNIPGLIGNSDPSVMSYAYTAKLVSPHTFRATVLVGLGATFLLYCVFIMIEILNNTINGEEDFTSRYDIPLLGSVPDFDEARRARSDGKGRYY
ncbi:MAG: hypothetical protein IKZ47_06575 [Clostridia bacterium]|nr:hypothetical protein [Clostridia bacterium]